MPTNSTQEVRRIVFTGKQEVHLETGTLPLPQADEVLVRTHLSLMSTGTENIVFNRLFDPGTHWDQWVKYPFHPGYTCVGEVLAAGAGAGARYKPGDRVAYRVGHASHAVVKAADCHPIPEGLPMEQAVWFALAKIGFHGIMAACVGLGDRVLIIGAGPIGQMALRWANAAGASRVTVVEPTPFRLTLARAGGATAVIEEPIASAREAVLAANAGELPKIVIDSTGNAAVFAAALGLAAERGTVVILGDTGAPTQQGLTSDVIRRGLHIVGAHDALPVLNWTAAQSIQLFFHLALTGRFDLRGLETNRFDPANCAGAYATANRERASTMGILFNWLT